MAIFHRKFETISIRDRANQNIIKPNHGCFSHLNQRFFLWEKPTRSTEKWYTNNEGKNKEYTAFLPCDEWMYLPVEQGKIV